MRGSADRDGDDVVGNARRVLGVSGSATPDEIDRAFRALALSLHPDRGGDAEQFAHLVAARSTLARASRRPAPIIVVASRPWWRRAVGRLTRRRRPRRHLE